MNTQDFPPELQKVRDFVHGEITTSKLCDDWFWDEHVSVVEKLALQLLKMHPDVDRTIVLLSVWFHDLGRAYGHDADHDVWGADFAKKYLTENGYDQEIIDGVYHACLAHRVKSVMPESVEAKVLASADALSHFENGFYLRIFYSGTKRGKGYAAGRERILKKIERDYHEKIFFDDAREVVTPMYISWKKVFEEIDWRSKFF